MSGTDCADKVSKDMSMCVVVDNLPEVDSTKYDKLVKVIRNMFSQVGNIVDFYMPYVDGKKTGSFAAVEFETSEEAEQAVRSLNNFVLDKKHTLRVNLFEDIEKYKQTPEKMETIEQPHHNPTPDLRQWLSDPNGRDQFVIRYNEETEVFWSDAGTPVLCYNGEREKKLAKTWCSQYVTWSPQGTYLATYHTQGIALWGGDDWRKLGRFPHANVSYVLFSPKENYLITWSSESGVNGEETKDRVIVWNSRSGELIREFTSNGQISPFRWSYDDSYVAKIDDDKRAIQIYELPSMNLLDKSSLKAVGIDDFQWSPSQNLISYWALECSNFPTRVSLVEIPSRKEIRQKNLFNVCDCTLHWQPEGAFLCVKVTRKSKSGKTRYTNFELFRPKEALVPVEMLEMKEKVLAFAWEPHGHRFAIVHGDTSLRFDVSFYAMNGGKKNNELTLLYTIKDKPCNRLYWSPLGNFIVLAGLGEINGALEFWDTDEKNSICQQEHFRCTSVEWDPSGRIVCTAACQPIGGDYFRYQMDNGYCLRTFQGRTLYEEKKGAFYQLLWRPRPKSLLTEAQYNEVITNLKKFEKKYQEIDRKREKEKIQKLKEEKKKQLQEFRSLVEKRNVLYKERYPELVKLRDGYVSDDDNDFIVQTKVYDEIISQKEEIVSK